MDDGRAFHSWSPNMKVRTPICSGMVVAALLLLGAQGLASRWSRRGSIAEADMSGVGPAITARLHWRRRIQRTVRTVACRSPHDRRWSQHRAERNLQRDASDARSVRVARGHALVRRLARYCRLHPRRQRPEHVLSGQVRSARHVSHLDRGISPDELEFQSVALVRSPDRQRP